MSTTGDVECVGIKWWWRRSIFISIFVDFNDLPILTDVHLLVFDSLEIRLRSTIFIAWAVSRVAGLDICHESSIFRLQAASSRPYLFFLVLCIARRTGFCHEGASCCANSTLNAPGSDDFDFFLFFFSSLILHISSHKIFTTSNRTNNTVKSIRKFSHKLFVHRNVRYCWRVVTLMKYDNNSHLFRTDSLRSC